MELYNVRIYLTTLSLFSPISCYSIQNTNVMRINLNSVLSALGIENNSNVENFFLYPPGKQNNHSTFYRKLCGISSIPKQYAEEKLFNTIFFKIFF